MNKKGRARGKIDRKLRVRGIETDLTDDKLKVLWLGKNTDHSGVVYSIEDIAYMYQCDNRVVRQKLRKMGLR